MKKLNIVIVGCLLSFNTFAASPKTQTGLPIEELRTFAEVYNTVKQGYVEPVSDKEMLSNAISGMLSKLDPHSSYLDSDAFNDLQETTQGEFGGLGIEVMLEEGLVKVISPIEDSPAFKAGVQSGDLIYKINEESVKDMTFLEAVKKMRGKPNTKVKISILRKSAEQPVNLELTREIIHVKSVKSKMVEPHYAWVRITQFQENTLSDLVTHLTRLSRESELKGLLLDLRNDPGGLLNAAIGVSSVFLDKGVKIVSTDGRTIDSRQEFFANAKYYLGPFDKDPIVNLPPYIRKVKMVVLVNSGSASASEIVAGALQDYKRAQIVGTTTFGKGSVQTILPLPNNTGIKLTTARYYTPLGRSIQAKGIVPDVVIEETAKGTGLRLRESDLERHLPNKKEAEAPKMDLQKGKNKEADDAILRLEFGSKDDYQFQEALALLKGEKRYQR